MKRPATLRNLSRASRWTGLRPGPHWLPPVIWATILFALSSGPGPEIPIDVRHLDKIQHAGAYAVLGGLVSRALAIGAPAMVPGRRVIAAGLVATAYGVSDEIHQRFVPRRSPDVFDVVADAVGGFLGALAHGAWRRRLSGERHDAR